MGLFFFVSSFSDLSGSRLFLSCSFRSAPSQSSHTAFEHILFFFISLPTEALGHSSFSFISPIHFLIYPVGGWALSPGRK